MPTMQEESLAALGKYGLGEGKHGIVPGSLLVLAERANSFWFKLQSQAGSVEGKLHLPDNAKARRLFYFQCGFPGRGAADLEQLHLKQLLDTGLAVFVPRHNGSLLTGKHSDRYISCPERQAKAAREKQKAIGEEPLSPLDKWLVEPLVVMQTLISAFEECVIYGHSFGGLSTFYSAVRFFESKPKHNIRRLISMAGATGRIRSESDAIVKMWSEHIDTDWIKERVNIGHPKVNVAHLKEAYGAIHEKAKLIPDEIDCLFLHPWGDTAGSTDELIGVNEPLELILSLGRGTLIVDKTQKNNPELEQLAHDMCDLKTESMLQLIDPDWIAPRQILTLDQNGIG